MLLLSTLLATVAAQTGSIGGGPAQMSNVIIEYTTDGEVRLNVMNITFVTTELHVVLLGCDVGYFDNYALSPPSAPSWQTQVTPFQCLECRCETFDAGRAEVFVPMN